MPEVSKRTEGGKSIRNMEMGFIILRTVLELLTVVRDIPWSLFIFLPGNQTRCSAYQKDLQTCFIPHSEINKTSLRGIDAYL